jgi:hypothetical protein
MKGNGNLKNTRDHSQKQCRYEQVQIQGDITMDIGLHDADSDYMPKKRFPNYALMKLSAYHKQQGDSVIWWSPLLSPMMDVVYSSKIFDYTAENQYLPEQTIKGGTGYNVQSVLPEYIDALFPDYSIYPDCDYAIGYITRGCPNKCRWCVVPQKEGNIKAYRNWSELVRADSKKLVLMDNNILSSDFGIAELESMIGSGYYIDINQGLDARLVTPEIALILSKLSWMKYIRFSCDTDKQIPAIQNAIDMLAGYGVLPYKVFVYMLITQDICSAARRVEALKTFRWINLYAQAERNTGITPNREQLEFAQRYVRSNVYRKENWEEYCSTRRLVFA